MSVRMKKHLTENKKDGNKHIVVTLTEGKNKTIELKISRKKADLVHAILESDDKRAQLIAKTIANMQQNKEETVPWREGFTDLINKFGEQGAALKGLRLKEGFSQVALAAQLDMDQGDISKMERGLLPIGKERAKRFAQLFKVKYQLFL